MNRTAVKRVALNLARANRAHPYTIVSEAFVDRMEARLRVFMLGEIQMLPSKGKTIK